jgi:hypothetical protein
LQRPAKKAYKQLQADDDHPGEQIEQGAAGAGHGQDEKLDNDSIYILIFKEKEKADSNLYFINQQLSSLKERMIKEQTRLNKMIEKKDKKIQSQSVIIQKMRTLIELQTFKIKTEDFSSLVSEEISNTSQKQV